MNTMAVTSRVSTNSSSTKSTVSTANPTSTKSAVSSGNYTPSKSGASVTAALNFNDYKDKNHVTDHNPQPSTSRGVKRLKEVKEDGPVMDTLDSSMSSNNIDDSDQKDDPVSTTTFTRSTCDRVQPTPHRVEGSFDSALIESEVRRIVSERLHLVKYEPYSCKRLSQDLAAELMERLKNLQYANYKIVVMVSLGNRAEAPGLQFGSRCLWNAKTDRLIYVKHTNGSVYAVILVYALYFS